MNDIRAIAVSDDTLRFDGEVSFNTSAQLIQQLDRLPKQTIHTVDCAAITHVDSAAVSLLLHLMKAQSFALRGVNASLQSLLSVYGVDDFFEYVADGEAEHR